MHNQLPTANAMATAVLAPSSGLTTSTGVLALLDEDDNVLRAAALPRLDELVPEFWAEIAEKLTLLTEIADDTDNFKAPTCRLAALIASKIYYHLEEYCDALDYALMSGDCFDVAETGSVSAALV